MRTFLKLLVLLAAAVPAVAPAQLREIFHPKADLPAFRCLVPDSWSSSVDAAGNLLLANRSHTANFSLSLVPGAKPRESLDELAKALLESAVHPPWDSREPVEISGYRGFKYTARVRHTNGVEVRAEVVLVAIDDKQIAACSMLLAERLSAADESTARLVQAAIHLVPGP
jgi:hypothetical protein